LKKASKHIVGITGGTGALGSFFIKKYKKKFNFRFYNKRIENRKDFSKWLGKNNDIEIFLHLAALSSIKKSNLNKKITRKINTIAPIDIIKEFKKSNIKNLKYFLFSSTSHVYKPSFKKLSEGAKRLPQTTYGQSKKIVEDFIFKNRNKVSFKIGIARIFNFHSKSHKDGFFIYDIKQRLKSSKDYLFLKRINTNRDYIHISQLCEILYFMTQKRINNVLNIGSGKSLSLIKLVKLIKDRFKIKTLFEYDQKKYPGLCADIKLLRKLGYKKKIRTNIFQ
tara:strand:- start:41 stop:877 length:837 start_codon:yes stop_codon:yes gene_type:complete